MNSIYFDTGSLNRGDTRLVRKANTSIDGDMMAIVCEVPTVSALLPKPAQAEK